MTVIAAGPRSAGFCSRIDAATRENLLRVGVNPNDRQSRIISSLDVAYHADSLAVEDRVRSSSFRRSIFSNSSLPASGPCA